MAMTSNLFNNNQHITKTARLHENYSELVKDDTSENVLTAVTLSSNHRISMSDLEI